MNKIRAAVVGAGIYGKHHMNAYRHNPDTVLVAICDTDTERCDDLAMAYGIQGYTRLDRLLGTVAKLAMRQPFVLFKGLTFQKLCLPGAFRPGDHHNKMLRPG
ncbi:Gfo/Idh/MocA family oxidoreductase, partial [Salmonella enterica]|uniref:Gfo/Idh/MocA family oxidoreductase n=1 Tax=Salmonella enterica TaxID=28901 RepID=UPI0039B72C83